MDTTMRSLNLIKNSVNESQPEQDSSAPRRFNVETPSLTIARIGAFSALIAVGTILSNVLFGFPLPPPLSEITAAPVFYLAIAALFSRRVGFWATLVGSAVGETMNIFLFGEAPGALALTYVPGIILARAPEVLIVYRFRNRSLRFLAIGMTLATVFETLVFLIIDWAVYSFTAFYCPQSPCGSSGIVNGFVLASFDFGTLIDLVWIPLAIALVVAARRSFNTQFFS
jgi:hypothetical protein